MLSVIGIGPGSQAMMTMEAVEALQAAEIVVGYKTYTHLVKAAVGPGSALFMSAGAVDALGTFYCRRAAGGK